MRHRERVFAQRIAVLVEQIALREIMRSGIPHYPMPCPVNPHIVLHDKL